MVFFLKAAQDPEISRIYSKNMLLITVPTVVVHRFINSARKSNNIYYIYALHSESINILKVDVFPGFLGFPGSVKTMY